MGVEDLRRQLRERQKDLSQKLITANGLPLAVRLRGVECLDALEDSINAIDKLVSIQPSQPTSRKTGKK